jgi:prevent-host-death family protein
MTQICHTSFMANVKITYAKAHFRELLARVAKGERITIHRYNTPVAELGPAAKQAKPKPKFGTLKGKVKVFDPHWLDPMTDEEANAFIEGRY